MKTLFLAILSFFIFQVAQAQNTEIWLVRHAEKEIIPGEKDPDLSNDGIQRAADLAKYLHKVKFDVAFTTATKRTRQTIDSLIIPKVMTYSDVKALVEEVNKNYIGKTVMIVGHSNTVLQIIEAFGAKKPFAEMSEEDYDYIFHLKVNGQKAKVNMAQFGRPHHL